MIKAKPFTAKYFGERSTKAGFLLHENEDIIPATKNGKIVRDFH